MAFFPHSFISHRSSPSYINDNNTSSFHPLFRLLDDFDQYTRSGNDHNGRETQHSSIMKSFTPKFDVKETSDTYELHGELPGIDQQNVNIEFVEADTLIVKGRVERSYTSGTPLSANNGALESSSTPAAIKDKAHQPTVEDEDSAAKEDGVSTAITKDNNDEVSPKKDGPKDKFWVSERSVGEFSRSFTFPVRVDHDAVNASMKNGILSIVVPKAKKVDFRKITIN